MHYFVFSPQMGLAEKKIVIRGLAEKQIVQLEAAEKKVALEKAV